MIDADLVVHNVQQRTPEWHALRRRYRTGSETAIVLGVSDYATIEDLLEERATGKQREHSLYVQQMLDHGRDSEFFALMMYATRLGVDLRPGVFTRGRYIASMDGVAYENGEIKFGVEIKCPARGKDSKRWKYASRGEIIEQDLYQVYVQNAVIRAPIHYLVVYDTEIISVHAPEATPDVWQKIERGWEEFERRLEERIRGGRRDPEWEQAAREFISAKMDFESANARLETAKEKLMQLSGGNDVYGCGVRVSFVERKGSVDWKAAFQAVAPKDFDVEQFRRPCSTIFNVNVVEDK